MTLTKKIARLLRQFVKQHFGFSQVKMETQREFSNLFFSSDDCWYSQFLFCRQCLRSATLPVDLFSTISRYKNGAVFGSLIFMTGEVVLSTLAFNIEIAKRSNYRNWPIIPVAIVSIACTITIYFAVITFAS